MDLCREHVEALAAVASLLASTERAPAIVVESGLAAAASTATT